MLEPKPTSPCISWSISIDSGGKRTFTCSTQCENNLCHCFFTRKIAFPDRRRPTSGHPVPGPCSPASKSPTPASKSSSSIFRIQEHYYYYPPRARGSFGRISRLTLRPMKGAKTNKKNVSSEPNALSLAYNVLTRLLFRTPPSTTLSSQYVPRCGGANSAKSTTPHSTQQRSANDKDKKSHRLKKTWVKGSRRNSYDIVKRYRCAQTVLIGFVSTQHFCDFMSQNHSYLLLTQTAEKRTNGTNVDLLFPAFYFSSLGPV